jgi:hypothetical protein
VKGDTAFQYGVKMHANASNYQGGEFWIVCSVHNLMKLVRFTGRLQPTA